MENKSRSKSRAATIDDIINEIESKSAGGNYIYRGESKKHSKVSSSLYREYLKYIDTEIEGFNMTDAQREMLKIAKNHIGESPVGPLEDFMEAAMEVARMNRRRMGYAEQSAGKTIEDLAIDAIGETITETADREILTELQHYGGKTNLIDFTTDYLIAIYFACSGRHSEKVGRVILLEKSEEIENMIVCPRNPRPRVIAQKSVFLQPSRGYVEISEENIVLIPANLKQQMLEHLRKFHDISTESIYNDIHGFIRYQNIHQSAYVQFYMGLTFQLRGREAKSPAEKQLNYEEAIKHYNEAINLNPDIGNAYHNRGWCWLYLQKWKKAREDLTIAQDMGVNVISIFRDLYENVEDFGEKTGIELPPDIARMLGDVIYKKEQPSVHVDDISPDGNWTVERFNELLSSQEYSGFYESRNRTEKLCEFGADLMTLAENKRWELTPKFMKYYFALYFGHRRVFGVNLSGPPKLAVWLPKDVLAGCNDDLFDDRYTYRDFRGIFPEHVRVAAIEKLLEFAYSWHTGLPV